MAFQNGRGGFLTITSPTREGVALTGVEPADWAATKTYVQGDMVLIGTDPNVKQVLCIEDHLSKAGGLTNTAGTLAGTEASNWQEVEKGLVYQLSNWTLTETEDTETATRTFDSTDQNTSDRITASGTADVFMDVDENIQKALSTGVEAAFKLYPHGIPETSGQKYPVRTFNAKVSSVGESFATTPLLVATTFNVVGDISRTIATVA